MESKLLKTARLIDFFKWRRRVITVACALMAVTAFAPAVTLGQERLKVIYSQFTMTNSATWFAREAGLFERHGLTADLIYVDSTPPYKRSPPGRRHLPQCPVDWPSVPI